MSRGTGLLGTDQLSSNERENKKTKKVTLVKFESNIGLFIYCFTKLFFVFENLKTKKVVWNTVFYVLVFKIIL